MVVMGRPIGESRRRNVVGEGEHGERSRNASDWCGISHHEGGVKLGQVRGRRKPDISERISDKKTSKGSGLRRRKLFNELLEYAGSGKNSETNRPLGE